MTKTSLVIRLADGRLVANNGNTKGEGPVTDDPTQVLFFTSPDTAARSMRGHQVRYRGNGLFDGAQVVPVTVTITFRSQS